MDNNNQNRNGRKRPSGQNIGVLALILVITLIAVTVMNNMVRKNQTQELGYEEFVEYLKEGEIDTAKLSGNRIYLTPKTSSTKLSRFIQYYTVRIPDSDLAERLLDSNGVHVVAEDTSTSANILNFLMGWVLPSALMIGLLYMMYSRMGGGGMMGVGKSNAKVYVQKETGVTFADVAGEDEAKESLVEIVDFLHNPQKYSKIGAKLPKGALLVGPPGTGKTLLAKAVAGEAHVPFYSLSGSDFVEMFVGVGASRVRDLFKQAQQSAPCIIFIDEIDAIGRSRDSRLGGNDEREQTLNQLLSEMDGFDSSKGLLVMAATNRVDILDPAILRPGRFDRKVAVGRPDVKGREEILGVHTKEKPLGEDVDLHRIAQTTLQNIMVSLGGRIAEEIIFDDITTGASQDIKQATSMARAMVTEYGMSEKLGMINYGGDNNEVFIGRDLAHTRTYSEEVASEIDSEVKRIIDECYAKAKQIILDHEDVLHSCCALLMEKEKIGQAEFEALFQDGEKLSGEAETPVAEA